MNEKAAEIPTTVMLDGEARIILAAFKKVLGGTENNLRRFLLQLRRQGAAELAKARLVEWQNRLNRYTTDADVTSGATSPYAGMVEPLRGPACPPSQKAVTAKPQPRSRAKQPRSADVLPMRKEAKS